MAKKTKTAKAKTAVKIRKEGPVVTHGGVTLDSDVTTGEPNKLTPKEQALVSKGEANEDGTLKKVTDPLNSPGERLNLTAGLRAGEAALTDKEKAVNAKVEDRLKYLEAEGETGYGNKTVKSELPLFRGMLTVTATASATGEKVSVRYEQAEPTTEDGVFYSFLAYHPSAIRDTMEIDAENKEDPTLRTYLEH